MSDCTHFHGSLIDPIEINSGQGGSIVADDDSIRVEHGQDLEHVVTTQALERGRGWVSNTTWRGSATTLAWGLSEVRKSITPSIIQELFVSPGCTLAEMITPSRDDHASGGAGGEGP